MMAVMTRAPIKLAPAEAPVAEPDWGLWQSILQQLRADNVDVKESIKELALRAAAAEREQQGVHEKITYALGMMVNLGRNLKDAHARIAEVVKRLDKLEAS